MEGLQRRRRFNFHGGHRSWRACRNALDAQRTTATAREYDAKRDNHDNTKRKAMKLLAALLTLFLAGCVTYVTGRTVNVTVSPTTNLRVQAVPAL